MAKGGDVAAHPRKEERVAGMNILLVPPSTQTAICTAHDLVRKLHAPYSGY